MTFLWLRFDELIRVQNLLLVVCVVNSNKVLVLGDLKKNPLATILRCGVFGKKCNVYREGALVLYTFGQLFFLNVSTLMKAYKAIRLKSSANRRYR